MRVDIKMDAKAVKSTYGLTKFNMLIYKELGVKMTTKEEENKIIKSEMGE